MIRFWRYRNDLNRILNFKTLLTEFCKLEESERSDYLNNSASGFLDVREVQHLIQLRCIKKHQELYSQLRDELAQQIPAIRRIALSVGVNTTRQSYPAPAVGGPIIPVDIFESVLEDHGYVPTQDSTRFDCINKIIGILKMAKTAALLQSFNPLRLLAFILRIPFLVIKQTGFNVEKIENEIWGKLFKLLFILALIYGLLRFGFSQDQILSVLKFNY